MELKMFAFGEEEGCVYYICSTSKEEAINLYKSTFGEDVWTQSIEAYENEEDFAREMSQDEIFNYYHDGVNKETDTIGNHINKYCLKPDIFACSEF
ncbi:hypothetical protein [Metabacillus arenae]|uniref:Uncharacterized protein n=1 Tax=Metabacillus arenae TaxID=2771434 RepID=A0A926NEM9_9BACI|nr:hypothetical protein [Metabacillus arenae]MBD1379063.1 hypothetical protein [Metabacillus arenae]